MYLTRNCENFVLISVAVSNELLSKAHIVLLCEGLDTVADVYVNGNLVGQSVNMFVRYIYNIKEALRVCEQFEANLLY